MSAKASRSLPRRFVLSLGPRDRVADVAEEALHEDVEEKREDHEHAAAGPELGQTHEEATFVDCESWGRQAEVMHQYPGKGREVMIEGRLRMDRWQDKQSGANRSKLVVVVESFQFIGGGGESGGGAAIETSRSRPASGAGSSAPAAGVDDGDIPF